MLESFRTGDPNPGRPAVKQLLGFSWVVATVGLTPISPVTALLVPSTVY